MRRRPARARSRLWLLGPVLVGLALSGCGTTPPRPIRPEYDLRSPDSIRRTKAVATVVRERDVRFVPVLIALLEDEDDAVRAAAGEGLVTLTGRDTGYRPWAPATERLRQQEEWRAWWESRGGGTAPPSAAPEPAGRGDVGRP